RTGLLQTAVPANARHLLPKHPPLLPQMRSPPAADVLPPPSTRHSLRRSGVVSGGRLRHPALSARDQGDTSPPLARAARSRRDRSRRPHPCLVDQDASSTPFPFRRTGKLSACAGSVTKCPLCGRRGRAFNASCKARRRVADLSIP